MKAQRYLHAAVVVTALGMATSACASYGPSYPRPARYPDRGVVVYQSPARDIGYRDGFEAGRDDVRDRDRYDPARSRRYRSADHDYDRRFGSRDEFRREYRVAFERGYAEGYRNSTRGGWRR